MEWIKNSKGAIADSKDRVIFFLYEEITHSKDVIKNEKKGKWEVDEGEFEMMK